MRDIDNIIERSIALTSPLFYILAIVAYTYQAIKWLLRRSNIVDWWFYWFEIGNLNKDDLVKLKNLTDEIMWVEGRKKKVSKAIYIKITRLLKDKE
jgi:hypothetical protein